MQKRAESLSERVESTDETVMAKRTKAVRKTKQRVGVVEIGSRAVRLLVGDVISSGIKARTTNYEICNLLGSLDDNSKAAAEMTRIAYSVRKFRKQAEQCGAKPVVVVGTEALRRVANSEIYRSSSLAEEVDSILDAKTEAMCSLLAASFDLTTTAWRSGRCLMVDQGTGSTEIALGEVGPTVKLLEFWSIGLGSAELLRRLHSNQKDLLALRKEVHEYLAGKALPRLECDHAVVLGSVATKFAWTEKFDLIRRTQKRYDRNSVQGTRVRTDRLDQFVDEVVSCAKKGLAWARVAQGYISPGDEGGDEGERIVSGAIPLIYIMRHFGQEEFVVSALGPRYGLAYLLGTHGSLSMLYDEIATVGIIQRNL